MHLYAYTCAHVFMRVYECYLCACKCVHVGLHVYMYVFACGSVSAYVHVYVFKEKEECFPSLCFGVRDAQMSQTKPLVSQPQTKLLVSRPVVNAPALTLFP